ncbi:MAG: hypothetical protein ACRCT1_00050 [Microcoleaceae cyanobacterium]
MDNRDWGLGIRDWGLGRWGDGEVFFFLLSLCPLCLCGSFLLPSSFFLLPSSDFLLTKKKCL